MVKQIVGTLPLKMCKACGLRGGIDKLAYLSIDETKDVVTFKIIRGDDKNANSSGNSGSGSAEIEIE